MAEEQLDDGLGEEVLTSNEAPIEGKHEDEIDLGLSPKELKAWNQGWRPEDQFEGDPDNWKTAGEYVLYGEFQEHQKEEKNRARNKEQEFENSISNLNKLHQARQDDAVNKLKQEQRQAVEEADTERYDQIQKEIDGHKTVEAEPEQTSTVDPTMKAWTDKNPWIDDPSSEKALDAKAFYNTAAGKPNATIEDALKYVDKKLAQFYPEQTNARREMPTMTEQGKRPSARKNRELTMGDLTAEERSEYNKFGSELFGSEKDFLKAVANARTQQ